MNSLTDQQLLRDYTERGSDPAFAELVRRHVDFVYSAALRMVCDAHLAEDVSQGVFLALAQNARQLTDRPVLSGWLHRTAQNLAANAVRSDVRRRAREQEAAAMNELFATEPNAVWEHIALHLDVALGELSEPDRDALLLRFFERKSAREMAHVLGVSDEAAQKRVNRAVERLREFFAKRGITVGASGLVAVISANAVQVAPVGLAVTISTAAALAGTTIVAAATATATKAIAMTTVQKALVSATVAAAVGTGIYESIQVASLQKQVQSLRQTQAPLTEQIQQLQRERNDATNRLALLAEENTRLKRNSDELLKLRGDMARLRNDAKETADPFVQSALAWKARLAELRQRLAQMPGHQIPQLQLLTEEEWMDVARHAKLDTEVGFRRTLGRLRSRARGNVSGLMSVALVQYVQAHGGELPGDISQLKPYFKTPMDDTILQQYQLLHTGKLSDVPPGQWLINEKSPLEDGFDTTFRVGYDRFGVERGGSLEGALGRFYEANPGQEPTDASQLLAYVKDPPAK